MDKVNTQFTAAFLSGCLTVPFGMPASTLYHKMQFNEMRGKVGKMPRNDIYTTIRHLYKNEGGLRRFYRGVFLCIPIVAISRSMQFGPLPILKAHFETTYTEEKSAFMAGAISGAGKQLVLHPFDRWKVIQQVTNQPLSKALASLSLQKSMASKVRQIYRGLSNSMLKSSLGFSLWVGINHQIDKRISDHFPYRNLCSGFLTGVVVQTLVFPFDIARTHKFMRSGTNWDIWTSMRSLTRIWKGFPVAVMAGSLNSALYFYLLGKLNKVFLSASSK